MSEPKPEWDVDGDDSREQESYKPERDELGRIRPGWSGNPGGRPKSELNFTDLLRAKATERGKLIDKLLDLTDDPDPNVALRAVLGILNRLEGMPRQSIETKDVTDPPAVDALREMQEKLDTRAKMRRVK